MSLRVLEIHTTLVCNIACAFCGLRTLERVETIGGLHASLGGDGPARERLEGRLDWSIRRHVADGAVPLPALLAAVREAAGLGCRVVTVSGGGEPLAAPERTFGVLAEARAAGMRTRVVTNGTLLASHRESLKKLDFLTISLLGPDAESHDEAAGAPGAFARLRTGLSGLSGPVREVHTPLTPAARERLEDLAVTVAGLGASTWWVLPLKGADVDELPPSAARRATELGLRHNLAHPPARAAAGCAAADGQVVIHADGTVTPCCSMRWGSGDVFDRGLGDIWRGPWLSAVRAAFAQGQRAPACAACRDPSRELREA